MRVKSKNLLKIRSTRAVTYLWAGAFITLLAAVAVLWSFRPDFNALSFNALEAGPSSFLPPEQAFRVRFQEKAGGIDIRFDIAPGHALYAERLKVNVEKGNAVLGPLRLPPTQAKWDAASHKNVAVYHLQQMVHVPITFPAAAPGVSMPQSVLVVTLQGCAEDGLCYAPITYRTPINRSAVQTSFASTCERSTHPPLAAPSTKAISNASMPSVPILSTLWSGFTDSHAVLTALHRLDVQRSTSAWAYGFTPIVFFVLFFIFGIALSALPCSWPMIPILSALVLQVNAHSDGVNTPTLDASKKALPVAKPVRSASWLKGFYFSLAYVLGIATMYALFGVIAALAGKRFGASVGHPWMVASFGGVIIVMAILLLRGQSFAFSFVERFLPSTGLKIQGRLSLAFVMGALSSLTLSPCMSAPLFGVLAFIAQTGHIGLGALTLFALGLGLGLPLVVLGAGLGAYLPRSGVWMCYVQRIIGLVLLGVGGYLLMPAGIALWHAVGGPQKNPGLSVETRSNAALKFQSVHTFAELNAAVQAHGKIALLRVFADNCPSCEKMENTTLASTELRTRLGAFNLIQLNAGESSPGVKALLKRLSLYGAPALLFFDARGIELTALRRIGYIPPETLKQLLQEAHKGSA